jgi:hypothetical protein
MLFRAYSPEFDVSDEVYAQMISEAATKFAQSIYGNGWKMIRVFESVDGKSAIVLSPDRRPFKVEAIR